MQHSGDDGKPCTRHAPASVDSLLALATIGTRAPGFQHDVASKIQSLVMSLEEIGERAEHLDDPELTLALVGARTAVTELTAQLQAFRALCRRPPRAPTPLPALIQRAAERAGVRVRGEPPAIEIAVSAPEVIHATALLLDGACGTSSPREVLVAFDAHGFSLAAGASDDVLAVATYVFRRSGGDLRCAGDAIVVAWSSARAPEREAPGPSSP